MANVKPGHRRKELVMPDNDLQLIEYWANRQNMSVSEYLVAASRLYIKFINQDYDLPTMEQQRLNQLIESNAQVVAQLAQLEASVRNTSAVILRATNGRNYLEDMTNE